jgi:hypothetical protein
MNIFKISLPVLALSMTAMAASAAMAHHMDKTSRQSPSMAGMQMTDTYKSGKQSSAPVKDSMTATEKNAVTVSEPAAKDPSALPMPETQWWKDR